MPKKKTALTIEERLQQALVPAEEQPYEVPENWVWVRLGSFIDLLRGVSYKKHDVHSEKMENDCLILRGGNIIEGGLDLNAENVYVDKSLVSELQLIRKNDVIIVSSTGSVKVIGRAGVAFCDYNDVAFGAFLTLARPKNGFNKSFIDIFFQSFLYRQSIRELASGVNINNIRSEYITNMPIPLPPLSEQQRIVERIEELFAKLEEAKERLQEAADSFAVRKAAILHKAFTGELTKQWRLENGVSDESWEEKKGEDFFEYVTSGSRGWAKYYSDKGSIFVRMGNLNHGTIELDFSDIQYVELPNQVEGQRSKLQKNDILISITADVGMIGLVREDMDAYINQHVALARPKNDLYAECLAWYFVSDVGLQQMQNKQRGATKIGLGLQDIRSIILKIPTLPEQHEIVRLIDDLLARERKAQQATEQALASIDLMKKSILARAFRGELGTNKASEESALELLKQVLAED